MQSSHQSNPDRLQVLLIDDDTKLCRLIAGYLDPLGYEVHAVHNGPEGLDRAVRGEWHAVLLDMMLPGLNGFEILKRLRQASSVPVLMLTNRGEEADRIVGLELGADDYIAKTCSSREMLARLRAVVRRSQRQAGQSGSEDLADFRVGVLHFQPSARTVAIGEQPVLLTPVEYALLLSLAKSAGRIKSREQLLEEIRERNYEVFDRSIDVHISALRRKLGDDPKQPRFIRTVRTAGYCLINSNTPNA